MDPFDRFAALLDEFEQIALPLEEELSKMEEIPVVRLQQAGATKSMSGSGDILNPALPHLLLCVAKDSTDVMRVVRRIPIPFDTWAKKKKSSFLWAFHAPYTIDLERTEKNYVIKAIRLNMATEYYPLKGIHFDLKPRCNHPFVDRVSTALLAIQDAVDPMSLRRREDNPISLAACVRLLKRSRNDDALAADYPRADEDPNAGNSSEPPSKRTKHA